MGRQKEDTSELSMKMSLDMALKNFIVPLQSFQVKKKTKQNKTTLPSCSGSVC